MEEKDKKLKDWKKYKIEELVEIIDGDRGKNYPQGNEFFENGHCLFLNTKNVPSTFFDFSDKMFISEKKDSLLRKGKLQRGDYVMTTRGTIGNFAFYSKKIPFENIRINSGMIILRPKNIVDEKFLGFIFSSPAFKNFILNTKSGSAQPQLPIRDLKTFNLVIPSLPTQQKIASVLSAYDELIENNTKRIKILEDLAQSIYNEWFVKFKFPGHEKVKIKNGVPEGWEVKNILDIVDIKYGKNLPRKLLNQIGIFDVYGAAKIIGKYDQYNREGQTVIVGCRGSVGRFSITRPFSFITNNSFWFDFKDDEKFFYYYQLKYRGVEDCVSGTAQPQITINSISQVKLFVPPKTYLDNFNLHIQPIHKQLFCLENINNNLRKTRDLLIPKLVSGEMEVK